MKKNIAKKLIATPNKKHRVSDFETTYSGELSKSEAKKLRSENLEILREFQDKLYAEDIHSVLILFQAMDAAGKDGTIKHVMSGINPQGCQVFSFKQPSPEEIDHDYLWRINKRLPEKGRIGIFNRSHYEDVLIVKVHPEILLKNKLPGINKLDDVTPDFWDKRYEQINNFEKYLTETGTIILKFFLNVSADEQKKRFASRLNDESKNWKFSLSDLEERKYWDDYMEAYSDMLTKTSTKNSPWYVIPADKKWFMRFAVSQIICEELEKLNPRYPQLSEIEKQNIEKAKEALERMD